MKRQWSFILVDVPERGNVVTCPAIELEFDPPRSMCGKSGQPIYRVALRPPFAIYAPNARGLDHHKLRYETKRIKTSAGTIKETIDTVAIVDMELWNQTKLEAQS